ncbi:Serine/threonine-protein kinase Nek6 [Dermatophagoides pteronyssinus]|uniref:non-specific serine/threonine protein kinase n=1 Tax=Dermatophagoides pteronyssinus TaxID=6956 RepID=A0ABQ8J616_DERPT|nr:Serine/threonine-protein kinase Nek6 [Dermatophagoides pteronyssinus]
MNPNDNDIDEIRFDDENLKNYDIKKLVGNGEFCDVYKAINRINGQVVALKRLKMRRIQNGQTRMECMREILVLRRLNHSNIIKHLDSFYAHNEIYMVLEYADAGDLSKMIRYLRVNNKLLSEMAILNYFTQICEALDYMHSKFIMHRDIKPANVLVMQNHTVKLADFGFSRLISSNTENVITVVGTPYYMAPERHFQLKYSFSADIWSMGCLLYELIMLYPPFYETNQHINMLIKKITDLDYKPIDSTLYSNGIRQIINNCLRLSPIERLNIQQILEMIRLIQSSHNNEQQNNNNNNDIDFNLILTRQRSKSLGNQIKNDDDNNNNNNNDDDEMDSIKQIQSSSTSSSSSSSSSFGLKKIYKNIKNMF